VGGVRSRPALAVAVLLIVLAISLANRIWQASFLCGAGLLYVAADQAGLLNRMARSKAARRLVIESLVFILLASVMVAVTRRAVPFAITVYVVIGLAWLFLRWRKLRRGS
jgi:hypothetical protein